MVVEGGTSSAVLSKNENETCRAKGRVYSV